MTICEFLALNETDQEESVWKHQHIAERETGDYWILLYQIDGFYVELYYSREKGEIAGLRPFSCTSQLDPYLDQICIGEIQLLL